MAHKLTKISKRFFATKRGRSNNDALNAMTMAKNLRIKYEMDQTEKPKQNNRMLGRSVMLRLPQTIREAELIVDTYLERNLFVIFTESICPFCHHSLEFLDALKIKYENIQMDAFGNKQLIQNYLQQICANDAAARNAPVAFVKNENGSNKMNLIGADGICKSWQTKTLHNFYPHLISPNKDDENYLNGTWDLNEWRLLTQIQANMSTAFGYRPTNIPDFKSTHPHEPHPQKIKQWAEYVGTPLVAKDIGNPQRPTYD